MDDGRLFQTGAAATGNKQSRIVVRRVGEHDQSWRGRGSQALSGVKVKMIRVR